MAESKTWSAVRRDVTGKRKGWCSHKHRDRWAAEGCARRLNQSWAPTGEVWFASVGGDIPLTDEQIISSPEQSGG